MPLEIHPEQSKENPSSYAYIKELFAHPIRPDQVQALTQKISRYNQPENPSSQKIIFAMVIRQSSDQYGQLCMVDLDVPKNKLPDIRFIVNQYSKIISFKTTHLEGYMNLQNFFGRIIFQFENYQVNDIDYALYFNTILNNEILIKELLSSRYGSEANNEDQWSANFPLISEKYQEIFTQSHPSKNFDFFLEFMPFLDSLHILLTSHSFSISKHIKNPICTYNMNRPNQQYSFVYAV